MFESHKQYVTVSLHWSEDGEIDHSERVSPDLAPAMLTMPDGRRYTVDQYRYDGLVPSFRCGGYGQRYTVRATCMAANDLDKVFYLYFERTGTVGRWLCADEHVPMNVIWRANGTIRPVHIFLDENAYTIGKGGIISEYAMGVRKTDGSGRRYLVKASCLELYDRNREFSLMLEEGGPQVGRWFYEDADVVHGNKVRFSDIPPSGYDPQMIYESMGVSQVCARFQVTIPVAEFLRDWNNEHGIWLSPEAFEKKIKDGIIVPTDYSPVMVSGEEAGIKTDVMKWGLKRSWASGPIFNLRCDSVETKAWVQEIKWNRCVIPCEGFFENEKVEKKITGRYYFKNDEEPTLYLAGIYEPAKGDEPARFTILTTEANCCVDIHDRISANISQDAKSGVWCIEINQYVF